MIQFEEQEKKKKYFLQNRLQENEHQEEILNVFDAILLNSKKIQTKALFDYNFVLTGFMGAGKTTISNALKHIFAIDVIEMDQIIAERECMSISAKPEKYSTVLWRWNPFAGSECIRNEKNRQGHSADGEARNNF